LLSGSAAVPAPTRITRHVCIAVPKPKDARRVDYNQCADREAWVQNVLGDGGMYVGRPKNDGGWYRSPTVKAGSMFANPFTLKEYSLEESLRLFRDVVVARAASDATTADVVALLPPTQRRLAEARHVGGGVDEKVGKSVAHLQLCIVGAAYRDRLRGLRGKRLGCFCDEASPCHAKVLADLAEDVGADCKINARPGEATEAKVGVGVGSSRSSIASGVSGDGASTQNKAKAKAGAPPAEPPPAKKRRFEVCEDPMW